MSLPEPLGTPYRIGLVCLGNICRSPMADVVLSQRVESAGLASRVAVASCGTASWHVGKGMDPRAAAQLTSAGYDASRHRAQHLSPSWHDHDLLLAMDAANLHELTGGRGETERVRLFRSFDPLATPHDREVPDPYYGGDEGFADVLAMVERTSDHLLAELRRILG